MGDGQCRRRLLAAVSAPLALVAARRRWALAACSRWVRSEAIGGEGEALAQPLGGDLAAGRCGCPRPRLPAAAASRDRHPGAAFEVGFDGRVAGVGAADGDGEVGRADVEPVEPGRRRRSPRRWPGRPGSRSWRTPARSALASAGIGPIRSRGAHGPVRAAARRRVLGGGTAARGVLGGVDERDDHAGGAGVQRLADGGRRRWPPPAPCRPRPARRRWPSGRSACPSSRAARAGRRGAT